MKILLSKHFCICLFSLFLYSSSNCQNNNDHFIRIVGNAKVELTADAMKVTLLIADNSPEAYLHPNKNFTDSVYGLLVTQLPKWGLKPTDLKKEVKGFYQKNTAFYSVQVKTEEQMDNMLNANINGVNVQEVKYIYPTPGVETEERLAGDAIKDAERKANKIAQTINKKIGKIISIDDKSSGSVRGFENGTTKATSLEYRVNVTFELND